MRHHLADCLKQKLHKRLVLHLRTRRCLGLNQKQPPKSSKRKTSQYLEHQQHRPLVLNPELHRTHLIQTKHRCLGLNQKQPPKPSKSQYLEHQQHRPLVLHPELHRTHLIQTKHRCLGLNQKQPPKPSKSQYLEHQQHRPLVLHPELHRTHLIQTKHRCLGLNQKQPPKPSKSQYLEHQQHRPLVLHPALHRTHLIQTKHSRSHSIFFLHHLEFPRWITLMDQQRQVSTALTKPRDLSTRLPLHHSLDFSTLKRPAAHDTTPADRTSAGLFENVLISNVPVQVTNSAPSTVATEASAEKENEPPAFGSASSFTFTGNAPFGQNKPQPKPHNIFTAASGVSSVHQNVSPQQNSGFGVTQEAIFQTPSSSQPGPKTSAPVEKVFETPTQNCPPSAEEANRTRRALDFSTGAAQNRQRDLQPGPGTPKAPPQEPKTFFETPTQNCHPSAEEANRTRRALDFSTGAAQVQTSLTVPTTVAETFLLPLQKEEEVQQLQRDQMKAELQQEIRGRDQELCEIRARVKACKGSLDGEWLKLTPCFRT
ncbi:hypothetical protein NQD34_013433 [Periophthalmus magnuspinnatus]|nr:hypothetical protein NQD34_013433 [Periophthalmus magnuspinnatus]